ncbi:MULTISPECIES: cytochrome P450 [Pseudomonas]|uniref:CamC, camphor-5-monooxygenase n=1 Tax=Pseudomonas monteilii TaxID=76759 RepID=A0AAE6RDK5_9PSED|nr:MULTISPECIES: cytochrome P450 [Pseudomonas]MDH4549891.1 cytochrome P450 [Pseudomonas sp. BN607]MDH4846089.1 cytochrome P450 [Pseudomonas sp. BN605]MDH4858761.1 cytochrome P450 [Pseudomonas sp. BN505]NWL08040.1 cytochrome P450 [Pseudomonas hunanensis]QHB28802.1 CamC, camphor-5-monooxygenase [Pseudomonas monteilii]
MSQQPQSTTGTRPGHVPLNRIVNFDMYNPPGLEDGLQVAWSRLHQPGVPDLVWTDHNGGHWIATRGKLIRDMFMDHQRFSSECPFIPKEAGEQYEFIPTSMDPPQHRPYRALISKAVGPAVVKGLEERIRELSIELIEAIKDQGACNFTHDYAEPFPVRVFLMMVDLPERDAPYLKHLADQITRPDGSLSMREASEGLFDYLRPIIDARRGKPGTDALSTVINGSIDGRPLDREEAARIGGLLLLAGLDTVVNFLSFVMQFLAGSPAHRAELQAHPDRVPAATEELLRRFSLVADGRMVKTDTEVDGVLLKAGDMVLLPQLLSGLDERENACPMSVNFQRENVTHTTFGHGAHHCAGAHLARLEVVITLQEWLKRIPDFQVAPGAIIKHHGGVVGSVESLPLVW